MGCALALQLEQEIEDIVNALPARGFGDRGGDQILYLRPQVERLCAGSPDGVQDISNQLVNARMRLTSTDHVGFDAAKDDLVDWTGSAGEGFKHYLNNAHDAYDLIATGIDDVEKLYNDYQAVVDASHKDLVNILQKYRDTFQAVQNGVDTANSEVVLTVVYVALTLAGSATSGGLALVAAGLEGGVSLAQVQVSSSTEDPNQIMTDLLIALGQLDEATRHKATAIKSTVDLLADWFSQNGSHIKQVQPDPPDIIRPAPKFEPASFELKNMPPLRHPVDTSSLTPSGTAGANGQNQAGHSRIIGRLSGNAETQDAQVATS